MRKPPRPAIVEVHAKDCARALEETGCVYKFGRLFHHACGRGHAACAWRKGHPNRCAGRRGAATARRRSRVCSVLCRDHWYRTSECTRGSLRRLCRRRSISPAGRARAFTGAAGRFYAVLSLATLLGVLLNFLAFDAIKMLYWSAVINGVAAAPAVVAIAKVAGDKRVMGRFAIGPALKILGWVTAAVMLLTAASALLSLGS